MKSTLKFLFLVFCWCSSGIMMAQGEFITTWKTDNPGKTDSNSIEIPVGWGSFSYSVDWGDGSTDNTVYTANATHTYASPGTYTVKISGRFSQISFEDANVDNEKILSVEQWGDQVWGAMDNSFANCTNLVVNAPDVPDLSNVVSLNGMFRGCESLNQGIGGWDVSNILEMEFMFGNATSFNGDIGSWDLGNVTSTRQMFYGCESFNQDLGGWDVSNVTDMQFMFGNATAFNQDIRSWDVGNVQVMGSMFLNAVAFDQDINTWNVGNVTKMDSMFRGCSSFNRDIGSWDVSNVTHMNRMFHSATSFNQDIGDWNVANVIVMVEMFKNASSFNQDIGKWNLGSVQTMAGMFGEATAFDQDLSAWDVSNCTSVPGFSDSGLSPENYDNILMGWSALNLQTGRVLQANNINYCNGATARQKLIDDFGWYIKDDGEDCSTLSAPFITTWKTNNVGASNTNQITIPNGDGTFAYTVDWGDGSTDNTVYTEPATHTYPTPGTYTVSISGDFPHFKFSEGYDDKGKLVSVDQWGGQVWQSMEKSFRRCSNMTINATDVPDLSQVTDMSYMFLVTPSFNSDIGNWDVSNVTNLQGIFQSAEQFNQDIGNWDVGNVTNMQGMFSNAKAFNRDISNMGCRQCNQYGRNVL